jgi:hypothetical protein
MQTFPTHANLHGDSPSIELTDCLEALATQVVRRARIASSSPDSPWGTEAGTYTVIINFDLW